MGYQWHDDLSVRISIISTEFQWVQSDMPYTSATAPPCPSLAKSAVGYAPEWRLQPPWALHYPDATSYHQSTDNKSWLTGAIPKSNFAIPAFGQGGNEKAVSSVARTSLRRTSTWRAHHETRGFQFRFEVFNLFNRANYANPNVLMALSVLRQHRNEPRFWQLRGRISF